MEIVAAVAPSCSRDCCSGGHGTDGSIAINSGKKLVDVAMSDAARRQFFEKAILGGGRIAAC